MKISKLFTLILVATILGFSGCVITPEEVGPTGIYSGANYPSTIEDLDAVLTSAYSNMRGTTNLYGWTYLATLHAGLSFNCDAIVTDQPGWTEMQGKDLSAGNSNISGVWRGLYTGINFSNNFLDRADYYIESKNPTASEVETINLMKGQAYFLRGFHYMHLELLFGESYISAAGGGDKMGVPIFDDVINSLDETKKSRSSVREVWDLIISDFQEAANLLQGKTWNGVDIGRATEWSAKGMLGKAYVYTEDWSSAKAVLSDVISNSGKSLMPFDQYTLSFTGDPNYEFNNESLFEFNVDPESKGSGSNTHRNVTTGQGIILAPTVIGNNGTEANATGLGWNLEFPHDKNLERFGFTLPIYSLVANPDFDPGQDPSPTNTEMTLDPAYKQQSMDIRSNKTADPRLFVNTLQPWIDSASLDYENWRLIAKSHKISPSLKPNYHGWSFRKYAPIHGSVFTRNRADQHNIYVLRLADVYLMYAEALINSGEQANGLEYLNKVKRRAYDYPIDSPSPIDYPTLSSPTMASDPVLSNNPLYYERWAELFMEGYWWFDVCRWKIGASEAAYFGKTIVYGPVTFTEKAYSWPIPESELSTNDLIVQNPGY